MNSVKKTMILAVAVLATALHAPAADSGVRTPMLVQHKGWIYRLHHYEKQPSANDGNATGEQYKHTVEFVYYLLEGDTVIGGRSYMKMYIYDSKMNNKTYFASYREGDGKVYVYDEEKKEDKLQIDFTMSYEGRIKSVDVRTDELDGGGVSFRRYIYENAIDADGNAIDLPIGVEGVGFYGKGLVHYLFEPPRENDHTDYEEFYLMVDENHLMVPNGAMCTAKKVVLNSDQKAMVTANNEFAVNLLRTADSGQNIILSPLSITNVLGMLNNGAAGKTQQQINSVLGTGELGKDAINDFCHKMMTEGATVDEQTKVSIANTIFMNNPYELKADFKNTVENYYEALAQSRDFHDGQTMNVINQWASEHTNGMIPKVIDGMSFNPNAVSYLLNAIYFKGTWANKFDPRNTQYESFNKGAQMPIMHQSGSFDYKENDLYQAVKLPYSNNGYMMTVFLPREGKTIGDVLANFTAKDCLFTGGGGYIVDLKMPRFETNSKTDLVPLMKELGITSAFDADEAEFPDMCYTSESLFIDILLQVADIKVNEEGTEAAAVTIAGMVTSGMPREVAFHATRPFFYTISEVSTGAIFFIGQFTGQGTTAKIVTPAKTEMCSKGIFNLMGQRMDVMPTRGMFISNGRKVIR